MAFFKSASGIEWHYELEGEGETLVFIHGWGVDKRIWRQQTKQFSLQYQVLTIDLPGHGQSSWEKVVLADMAADIKNLLAHLGLRDITLVSSSLGGLFALKYYQLEPENIRRLIFVGSLPKFAKSEDYPYGLEVARMRKLGGQLASSYPSIVNIFFRSLFTKQERNTRRYKWMMKFRQPDDVPMKPALVEYLDILEHEDLRDVFQAVAVPLHFINGTHDEICTMESVEHLKELNPAVQFSFFEQCGHFPFLSKPHDFNEALKKVLSKTAG